MEESETQNPKTLRDKLEELYEITSKDCGCEPGGGIADLEPGFTCGIHSTLDEAIDTLGSLQARITQLEEAAKESLGEIQYLYAGLLRHGQMPECTEQYLRQARDRLDEALKREEG